MPRSSNEQKPSLTPVVLFVIALVVLTTAFTFWRFKHLSDDERTHALEGIKQLSTEP